ncbi:MAG: hypothetical protein IKA36_02710 [Clostridia bacterium]|nr:hypothetical protein [Clostridia bacterium]
MGFVKWLDSAPLWVKIIFALPALNIIWAIYRLVKGAVKGNIAILLGGVLWLLAGWAILWIIDLISIIGWKKPIILA